MTFSLSESITFTTRDLSIVVDGKVQRRVPASKLLTEFVDNLLQKFLVDFFVCLPQSLSQAKPSTVVIGISP